MNVDALDRLRPAVLVLLVAAIAWTLADGLWFFFGGARTAPAAVLDDGARAEAPRRGAGGLDARGIAALELFGRPRADAAPGAAEAPRTQLQLALEGVFLAEEPADSTALVAQRNQPGRIYGPGDRLPGNAELVEVLADRIVLQRAGRMETLRFPEAADGAGFVRLGGGGAEPGDPGALDRPVATLRLDAGRDDHGAVGVRPPSAAAPERSNVARTVERLTAELDADPDATLDRYGLEPVTTGDASGYRIGDAVPAERLSSVGLRPGDVVLSVNGQPVGDIRSDRGRLQGIVDAGSARIEIQRGDRRFFVTAPIR